MADDPFHSTIHSVAPDKLEAMKDALFDFKESGTKHVEAANKFQAGLDKVIDVLLILVMKLGRASAFQIAAGAVQVVCLVALIISTVQILSLRSEVRDLLHRQEEVAKSQKRIEKATSETQEKLATTSETVKETQETVRKVEQTAPQVEIDKRSGKAKLVLPKPTPTASTKPTKGLEIPLE